MACKVKLGSRYDLGLEIARGNFGVVYSCVSKETNSPYALKIMPKRRNKKDDVMREVNILKKIKHHGILKITDFMECDKEYILVTELLNGGELFDFVLEKEFLDEKSAAYYIKQTLEATNFLHKNNVIHLDLKPENIVIKDKGGEIIKIIDFGVAQDLDINPKPKIMTGTPEFIAPEVLNFEPVSFASDMWAIGIITFVLLSGMSPFLGDNDLETVINISTGEFEYPDPYTDGGDEMSSLAKSFINDLIIMKPKDRIDGEACLKHDWITNVTSKLVGTERLKSFRARRRWLAVTRAARLSVCLTRMIRGSSSSTGTDPCGSLPGMGPDDVLEA